MANTYAQASVSAVELTTRNKVMNWSSVSGGAWGRRGAVIDSTGAAWATTGDGVANNQCERRRRRAGRRE
jgi:hypothetical protein